MGTSLHHLEFLGFDVFGTVVDWRTSVARAAEPFLERYHVNTDPFTFADEWRALYQPAMQKVCAGERPWIRLDKLQRENLEVVLANFGADLDAIPEAALHDMTRTWERLEPWPDTIEGLTRLKKRYPIGTLSNGHIAGMMQLARFAGLPWDVIVGAEFAKCYKPQPEAYLKSAEAVAVEPQHMALVAAHNGDLAAARACGMRTIFVRRPTEHGPAQTIDLEAEQDWDIVAESLVEVARILGC